MYTQLRTLMLAIYLLGKALTSSPQRKARMFRLAVAGPVGPTYVNGRPVHDLVAVHRLFADHVARTERFVSGRPIAGMYHRTQMGNAIERLGQDLGSLVPKHQDWEPTLECARQLTPTASIAIDAALTQEKALRAMVSEAVPADDFHGLKTWDGWKHERLDGDSDELAQEAQDAEALATQLTFELHRIRKTTANRVALSKLGLVPRFSWSQAWAETKQQMRDLGAEIRKERGFAKQVERELRIRAAEEHEAAMAVNRWNTSDMEGVTECDSDFELPTEYDECQRLAREEGRSL